MWNSIKERIFPFIIALSALSVSASAAFYSVTGLSKLFAGASFAVIIMASSLEVSKLVIASLLYQYWDKLNNLLKIYLTIAAFILIAITSAGIYGFLSSAYQETANKSGIVDKQIELLETKKQSFNKTKTQYETEKQSITENISNLRNALGNNTQSYVDRDGNVVTYSSSANRRAYERQLEAALKKDEKLTGKIQTLNDTIISLEVQIVEVSSNSEIAAELGPLKYLSNLTGTPMDKIINYLLLVIIFVFDPLAISLVIAANFAFKQLSNKKREPQDYTMEDFSEEEIESFYQDNTDWEEPSLEDLPEEPYEIYISGSDSGSADWEIIDEEKEEIVPTFNESLDKINQINKSNMDFLNKQKLVDMEIQKLKEYEEKKKQNKSSKDDDNIITYN